jgi:putative phosphoesterase
MKIGLLSDTHGNVERTHSACQRLKDAGAAALVHAGDIGPEPVLYTMMEVFDFSRVPLYAVWGNMERWSNELTAFPLLDGVTLKEVSLTFDADGYKVAVTHGDVSGELKKLIAAQEFDLVVTGHTHVASDRREGRTRIINPGAVHRSTSPSVALLDSSNERLEMLYLPK